MSKSRLILTVVCFLMVTWLGISPLHAQAEKGSQMFSVGGYLMPMDDGFFLSASCEYGLFATKALEVGLGTRISYFKMNSNDTDSENTDSLFSNKPSISLKSFLRYNMQVPRSKVYFFVGSSIEIGDILASEEDGGPIEDRIMFAPEIGMNIYFKTKAAFYMQISYLVSLKENDPEYDISFGNNIIALFGFKLLF